MLKAIVLDMDATLLTSENEISPATLRALLQAQQAGTTVVLASGRSYLRLLPDASKLHLADYGGVLIDVNGTSLYNVKTQQRRYIGGMDAPRIKRVVDFFSQFEVEIQFNQDDAIVTYLPEPIYAMKRRIRGEMRLPADYPWTGGMYSWLCDMRDGYPHQTMIRDLAEAPTHANKLSIVQEPDKIHFVADSAKAQPIWQEFEFAFSDPRKMEVTPKNVSKGSALLALMQERGWQPDEVAAFGDSGNDVSMLKVVKYSVAMGNALPVAKRVANYSTADNNHDGIAKFLQQLNA